MADIELVIKIPEEMYNTACNYPEMVLAGYSQCIKNGIPLHKGHGDLIDRKDLLEYTDISISAYIPTISRYDIITVPTIIPADRGDKNDINRVYG